MSNAIIAWILFTTRRKKKWLNDESDVAQFVYGNCKNIFVADTTQLTSEENLSALYIERGPLWPCDVVVWGVKTRTKHETFTTIIEVVAEFIVSFVGLHCFLCWAAIDKKMRAIKPHFGVFFRIYFATVTSIHTDTHLGGWVVGCAALCRVHVATIIIVHRHKALYSILIRHLFILFSLSFR